MTEKPPLETQDCPVQMPVSYFGATYQDSQCIDGYLWDLDSGDGEYLTSGGDIPCPFCNPDDHLDYMKNNDEDLVVCEVCSTELSQFHWSETNKPSVKLYGFCTKCDCNQWGVMKEAKEEG
ncbi:hypothetical protein [Acinetobacter gerneri]|uniref:hypothetical protein n=1 Tax=Acinetobacter gerneri TaxID=202952 RepID=UPI0032124C62